MLTMMLDVQCVQNSVFFSVVSYNITVSMLQVKNALIHLISVLKSLHFLLRLVMLILPKTFCGFLGVSKHTLKGLID